MTAGPIKRAISLTLASTTLCGLMAAQSVGGNFGGGWPNGPDSGGDPTDDPDKPGQDWPTPQGLTPKTPKAADPDPRPPVPDSGGTTGVAPAPSQPAADAPPRLIPLRPHASPTPHTQAPIVYARSASVSIPVDTSTSWDTWWRFNRAPFLRLKDHVYAPASPRTGADAYLGRGNHLAQASSLRPSDSQLRNQVLPVLMEVLRTERDDALIASALIAIAKTARTLEEGEKASAEEAIVQHLDHANLFVSEAAVVAYGLLSLDPTAPVLAAILLDAPRGHQLLGVTRIPYRTRSYAAFGLGLLAEVTEKDDVRRYITHKLIEALEADDTPSPDFAVACLSALSLIELDKAGAGKATDRDGTPSADRTGQLSYLLDYFDDSRQERVSRAHALTALTRIWEDIPNARREELKEEIGPILLDTLRNHSRERNEVLQSCVLAMAKVADSDKDDLDSAMRRQLMKVQGTISDQQTRAFTLIALGEIASRRGRGNDPGSAAAEIQKYLLNQLGRGKTYLRPWAGLGLGLYGFQQMEQGFEAPADISSALRSALKSARTPAETSAYCTALGLVRDTESLELILEAFESAPSEDAREHAAVALGMLSTREAIEPLKDLLERSEFQPQRIFAAAVALGLSGDKGAVPMLVEMLHKANSFPSQSAIAFALGNIGDTRAIPPLVAMVKDQQLTSRSRAMAVVALGAVADTRPMPWNWSYSGAANYQSAPSTFFDPGGNGVLNIP